MKCCIARSLPLTELYILQNDRLPSYLCTHLAQRMHSVNLLRLKMHEHTVISLTFKNKSKLPLMSHPPPPTTLIHSSPLKKHSYEELSVLTFSAFSSPILSSLSSPFPPQKQLSSGLPNPVGNSWTSYYLISEALDTVGLCLFPEHFPHPLVPNLTHPLFLPSCLCCQLPDPWMLHFLGLSPWSTAPTARTSLVISSNFMDSCSSILMTPH